MNKILPYKYNIYGSKSSIDKDVIIQVDFLPVTQEERKILAYNIKKDYNLDWNIQLAIIRDGVIVDCIFPKSSPDSLNNALFNTYYYHEEFQDFPCLVNKLKQRNKLLAIYKTVRTILSQCTRTHYRSTIKPTLKWIHPFESKLKALESIDFITIDEFNQDNTSDIDIWKIIAFYLIQNMALIDYNKEVYCKELISHHDKRLDNFLYRREVSYEDKIMLNQMIKDYLALIRKYSYKVENEYLICDNLNEKCNIKNEMEL